VAKPQFNRVNGVNSFCVRVQRSNKNFPLTSVDIEKRVGTFIVKNLKKKVDLENPDITLFIEIVENYAFLYTEKISGLGGLPVGTAGKAICLLSDGIDSPVAAWQMMKRGLEIVFVHFYAYAYAKNEKQSLEKIREIVNVLNSYQGQSKLYLIPFRKIQQEIFRKKENKFCCLLCKRAMLKIAEKIAKKENCFTLITGDSLGQVASQTLENMRTISNITDLLVLRPLLGFDKQETITMAKNIKTYNLSIIPSEFYCRKFLPKHPATKSKFEVIKDIEEKIGIDNLFKKIIYKTKIERF
jgi:thiamine biosynthesis protein ThiI